jgi:hypothetical protein
MARVAELEGEVERRGDTVPVRMRLCRDDVVVAAFKQDYSATQAIGRQIIDDLVTEFERQEPGAAMWLLRSERDRHG